MTWLRRWLTQYWWRYEPSGLSTFSTIYHWFNLAEGVVWCVIALFVFRRYLKSRKSKVEIVYAIAFVTFGLSDFIESEILTGWLIVSKGINLLLLFVLRGVILKRHYPTSKTF
jgi:multisubunit Na+/H+ antiporter MnhE subunit